MQAYVNALLVPWKGREGMSEADLPSDAQVAIVYGGIGFLLARVLIR